MTALQMRRQLLRGPPSDNIKKTYTMVSISLYFCLFATNIIAVSDPPSVWSQEVAKRFTTEAPRSWELLKSFQDTLEGAYHRTMKELSGDGRERTLYDEDGQFKLVDGNRYLYYKLTDANGESYQTTFCFNSKYGFVLDRKSSSDTWQIRALEKNKTYVLDRFERQGGVLHVNYSLDGQSLLWIIKQPGFKLKGARTVGEPDAELVKVEFETTGYLLGDRRITGGNVTLDPNRFWSVTAYEVRLRTSEEAIVKGTVEYQGELTGFPLPRRSITDYVVKDNPKHGHGELITEFKDIHQCNAPATDFTLSAFGLAEPTKTTKGTSCRYIWLCAIALVCLLAASLLRCRLRRAQ
jgi:hypothetical protein